MESLSLGPRILADCRGPHPHECRRQGLDSHVHEPSRARAARALAATVQSRMAGANVAREMERGMKR